jgi:hypothetical protein
MHRRLVIALVAALVLGPGCGDDGGGETSGKSEGSEEAACKPVGSGGGAEVAVALTEWSVSVAPAAAPPGEVTFQARNTGKEPHELVVVKGDRPDGLPVKDGQVEEDALSEGAFIGEVEEFLPGQTCPGTFELAGGPYVLFCNIVERLGSTLESHYEKGMRTGFTVQ